MLHRHSVADHPGQLVIVAGIAAVGGALLALLFAPKPGTEMRRTIRHQARRKKANVAEYFDANGIASDRVLRAADKMSDEAEHIRRNGER